MRSPLARWLASFAGVVLFVGVLNAAAGLLTLKRLEKKAGAPIHGTFIPHLIQSAFTLKDPSFDWQDRFQISSGTLVIHYEPLSILPGRPFRTQIRGRDLGVRLYGELAASQGFSQVRIDFVEADLVFSRGKTPEIYLLHIQSPQIRFHLVKSP